MTTGKHKATAGIIAFILCILTAAPVYAHTAPVSIKGGSRYKSVQLTPAVYNAASADLSDLRISNSKGEAVPYFVYSSARETASSRIEYEMSLTDSFLKNDGFFLDFALTEERDADIVATSLRLDTEQSNFAKTLQVYGGYDGVNWEAVQGDKLYSIDGIRKLYIDFRVPQKYTHYRLNLHNNLERISFHDVKLVYESETAADSYFTESFSPAFTVASENKRTNVTLAGTENLRILDVELTADSMFRRPVSVNGTARKELFNLIFDGIWSDTVIPLNGSIQTNGPLVLTIEDGDDRPIDISAVTVRYLADELVFEGAPGEAYTLTFGGDADAPVYDIARYKNEILASGEIEKAALGEIQYAAPVTEEPSAENDYTLAFNITVISVAALLGAVLLFQIKRRK